MKLRSRLVRWTGAVIVLVGLVVIAVPRASAQLTSVCPTRASAVGPRARRQLAPVNPTSFTTCLGSDKWLNSRQLAARELAREIDLLPTATTVSARCRATHPTTLSLRFTYSHGPAVTLLVQLGACHLVTNGLITRSASGRWAFVLRDLELLGGQSPAGESLKVVREGDAPPCSNEAAPGVALPNVAMSSLATGGAPFGVAADRQAAFVAQSTPDGDASVLVLSASAADPQLERAIRIPGRWAAGAALTPDDRELLVVTTAGVDVLSTARAQTTGGNAVLGTLDSPDRVLIGGIEVAVSSGGRFAFVSEEYSDDIAVYDLRASARDHFRRSVLIGTIPLAQATVGMAFSPNGRWLYATSELAQGSEGSLSVIDVARAERSPGQSVIDSVSAGCQPVRVVVAPNGRSVWVTARGSNVVENFSATRLLTDPAHSLTALIRVGQSPVGLAFVNHGSQLVVADSDRFDTPGAESAISVLDVTHPGRPTLDGELAAGAFPRDMALAPNGTLLISDYLGDVVQLIATSSLAGQ